MIAFCFSVGRSLKATLVEAVELVESEDISVWLDGVVVLLDEMDGADRFRAFRIRDLMLAPSFTVALTFGLELELLVMVESLVMVEAKLVVSEEAIDACAWYCLILFSALS